MIKTLLTLLLTTSSHALSAQFQLNPEIQNASATPFIPHKGKGEFDSYLSMNLPFAPMAKLLEQFQAQEPRPLKDRGEAHITIITPVEFWHQLKPAGITIQQIDQIANEMKLQSSAFEIICLGKGEATLNGKDEQTYYVVVQSEALLNIRRKIQSLIKTNSGAKSDFQADKFYPHITMAYTDRDLHESDGVIKNNDACIADLKLVP